ncbi:hypothetical protein ES703_115799 [subsurface metagenome]
MKLYKIAFRNILRNKRRSILSGVAIAVSAMVIVMLISLYAGLGDDLESNVYNYLTGHIRIRHNEYDANEDLNPLHLGIDNYKEALSNLDKLDDIKATNPRMQFGTAFIGSTRLFINDIKDWPKFIGLLKSGTNPIFSFIAGKYLYVRQRLSRKGIILPNLNEINDNPDNIQKGDLLYGINEAFERYALYDIQRFSGVTLKEETKEFTKKSVSFEERAYFNRLLLQDAFPDLINISPRVGKIITGMGMGTDFERDTDFINLKTKLVQGSLPETGSNIKEIILTSGLADKLNVTMGDRITISTKTRYLGMNGMTFKVKGIVKLPIGYMNLKFFYLPLDTAQKLLKMEGSVSEILILLKNENRVKNTVPIIKDMLTTAGIPNFDVLPWSSIGIEPMYIMLVDYVGYYMALFFFLLGSTVIITTTMMVIYERMKEIGTVAAMGMTGGQIVRLFFLEAFFIGAFASFIGVVIGSGITIPLSIVGMDWTEALEGLDMAFTSFLKPTWSITTTIIVFVYSTAIASIASFFHR